MKPVGTNSRAEQAIAFEQRVAAPNYAPIPVVLDRGEGSWLWDADGKRYLDFMSAYSAVSHGHAHPRLVSALIDQAQRVSVTSRAYHSTELGPFLTKLVDVAISASRPRRCPPVAAPSPSRPDQGGSPLGLSSQRHFRRPGQHRRGARQFPRTLDHHRWFLE